MKTNKIIIHLLLISVFISAYTVLNAQTIYQKENPGFQCKLYQNYTDPFNNVTRIEYTLEADAFVKIFVTDISEQEMYSLVLGEVEAGKHNVFFRNPIPGEKGSFICKMEVCQNGSKKILFSDQKILNFDSLNKTVKKK